MRIRPVHIWWMGAVLFAPSILMWVVVLGLFTYKGMLNIPFDWTSVMDIYLPLLAAIIGFTVPLVCLRFLRHASGRVCGWGFGAFLAVMLTWGIVDVRHSRYQMGGHDDSSGTLVAGQTRYWHTYYTWYFHALPPDREVALCRMRTPFGDSPYSYT